MVLAPGTYTPGTALITPQRTQATEITLHGSGATLLDGNEIMLRVQLPVTVKNVTLDYQLGTAIGVSGGPLTLENVVIRAPFGISGTGTVVVRQSSFVGSGSGVGIQTSGSLTIDGVTIQGGAHGIVTDASMDVANLLVHGTSDTALSIPDATGTIAFSTVADSGNGIACNSSFALATLRSVIVWTPGSLTAPISGMCQLESTIAGPIAVPGAMNVNPQFVNSSLGDYHLMPNSAARDAVDDGPPSDFEGDPRPSGVRWDLGADEVR